MAQTTQDIRIGWIGLGEMGYGMAKNLHSYLASHGSHLTVWNRSPGKTDAIKEQGARVATSIEDLASTSSVIFTSLANDAAVENVYEQLVQLASEVEEQIIFVETSTIHPTTATKISQLVAAYPQHRYLQCPVFGRPDRAHAGQLVWVASGDAATIEKLQPYFGSMSKNTIDLKTTDVSKASSFKLLGNFFVVGTIELLAEGFALAEKVDIDKSAMLHFIESFFPTPSWIGYSQKIASGSTEKAGGFPVTLGLKDVGHMKKLAADHGATLPTADIAYRHLERMKAQGKGDQDWSSIIEVNRTAKKAENFCTVAAPGVHVIHSIEACFVSAADGSRAKANITFTSLTNDAAVEQVYETLIRYAATAQEQIRFVETGTLYPELSLRLQKELVDCLSSISTFKYPVFGRPEAARAAQLVWTASGGTNAVNRLRPYFETMSRTVLDLKATDVAAASTLKLLGNFIFMSNTSILAESVNIARKSGFDSQHLISWVDAFLPVPLLMGYSRQLVGGAKDEAGVDMTTTGAPTPVADAVYKDFAIANEKRHSANMPATIIKVPVIEDIHRAIGTAVEEHKDKDVFVYFYASIDPATGKSWCPDCVTAGPIIEEYFSKIDNAVLIDAPVGDRPKWKDPNHFLRHDSVVKITAVPTLVHWSTKSQLVENDCEDLTKLDKFVKRA
ncbi:hypothetical protein BGZ47_008861 [Haplosporangium gracile]|nr:hypothetical protein BGZ47_008861 [Haplosporangium gracile]